VRFIISLVSANVIFSFALWRECSRKPAISPKSAMVNQKAVSAFEDFLIKVFSALYDISDSFVNLLSDVIPRLVEAWKNTLGYFDPPMVGASRSRRSWRGRERLRDRWGIVSGFRLMKSASRKKEGR
jgi:hypothetical protein